MSAPRPKLTPKQERIFRFMAEYFPKHQAMPSIRDICNEFGIKSTNGAVCHLVRLAAKGYISMPRNENDSTRRARNRGYEIAGLSEALAPVVATHVQEMLGPDSGGKPDRPQKARAEAA